MATLTCIRTAKREGETYEEFLEARKAGFGGSDIGDLLDSEPYGCKRRLFLSRLGLLPDGDLERGRHHCDRGRFFEAPVAALYTARTGRKTGEIGTGYLKQYPFVRANADRLVSRETDGSAGAQGYGVLEIKVPAAWSFKKIKKEGLPEAYILQLQWQMLCYGTKWGSFAIYWPDGHELLWFDVERDDALIAELLKIAQGEWHNLELAKKRQAEGQDPVKSCYMPPLEKTSTHSACQNCPGFETCHGFAIPEGVVIQAPELEGTAERYSVLVKEIKKLEFQKEELKEDLKAEFAKFPAEKIVCGRFEVGLREQTRESIDSVAMKKDLAHELLVRYTKQTTYQTLTVKEKK